MAVATITETRTRMANLLTAFVATLTWPINVEATVNRYLPRQLNAAELPAFILLPGEATHTIVSADEEETSRLWRLRLYIAPTAQGIEAEIEERAEVYVDVVRRYLNQRPALELNSQPLPGIRRAWVESDRGIREGRYPDSDEAPYYLFVEWGWRTITRRNRK